MITVTVIDYIIKYNYNALVNNCVILSMEKMTLIL